MNIFINLEMNTRKVKKENNNFSFCHFRPNIFKVLMDYRPLMEATGVG